MESMDSTGTSLKHLDRDSNVLKIHGLHGLHRCCKDFQRNDSKLRDNGIHGRLGNYMTFNTENNTRIIDNQYLIKPTTDGTRAQLGSQGV